MFIDVLKWSQLTDDVREFRDVRGRALKWSREKKCIIEKKNWKIIKPK